MEHILLKNKLNIMDPGRFRTYVRVNKKYHGEVLIRARKVRVWLIKCKTWPRNLAELICIRVPHATLCRMPLRRLNMAAVGIFILSFSLRNSTTWSSLRYEECSGRSYSYIRMLCCWMLSCNWVFMTRSATLLREGSREIGQYLVGSERSV